MRFARILIVWVVAVATACGSVSGGTEEAADTGTTSAIDLPVLDGADAGCSSDALVSIGVYPDETCATGTESSTLVVDTTAPCVPWPGGGSVSAATCYEDRVCMTHVTGDACSAGTATALAATSSSCTPGPGGVWLRLLEGTGDCPEAPDGFACEATPPDAPDDEVCPLE